MDEKDRHIKQKALAKFLQIRPELIPDIQDGYRVLFEYENDKGITHPLIGTTSYEGRTVYIYRC